MGQQQNVYPYDEILFSQKRNKFWYIPQHESISRHDK